MRHVLSTVFAIVLCATSVWMTPGTADASSLAGSYLAGRHASVQSDFQAASDYYGQAMARDPGNADLMESAVLAYLALGNIRQAIPLAKAITETGVRSQAARMVITAGLVDEQDFETLAGREVEDDGIGPWVDGLIKGWAYIGMDDVPAAVAHFDTLAQQPGMNGFVSYHKALALASVGDFAGAEALFEADAPGAAARTRRGIMAHAEILSQLGRNEDALREIRANFGNSTDPELDIMIAALEAGETLEFTHVPNARAGMAEVFFTFGAVLQAEQAGDYYTLLYTRVARYLRPSHMDALLLTADLLENLGQYKLAIAEYRAVAADHPAYHAAELGRAAALRRMEKPEQAIEVLEQLTRSHGDLAIVHSTLGDVLRAEERYAEAIEAYDISLDLTAPDVNSRWFLHYVRGISFERSGDSDAAETDFRAALAINPNQPQVLNYLGYSLVEQQRKLDEALEMIERAVAASPDSGYIVDSLGWVYYRLGRYEEAVDQMERAVELEAVDPVVNDHLGDVYWAVGRYREAEFQWKRALSFLEFNGTDTEADPDRIRRKLEVGLDAVLAEEGAEPLKVANDD
ncbi:tetratricopeptide repeat protein [Sulfitobacter sp. S190]|uniref:tetratricopeptide repeat protein n=1 Tax=Sulfitobacter sp. S190 TaxID=2867022 RepID=UPI0021A67544|nr:tetratricopeptide repeat protein [Sulfitobacter sp. S190]UWR23098.1 tetratricopeptide repeat protein [Sulfitobacter sp. S190]